jgi:hypothetical protein
MDEKFLKGLAAGVVAAAAIAYFGPSIASSARPLLRKGIKAAVKGYVQSQEMIAELQELAEDAIAEAWAELKSEAEVAASASTAAAASAVMSAAPPSSADKETVVGPKKKRRG